MVPNRQRGASMWGVILVVVMAAFYVLLGLKLFPVYMANAKAKSALNRLAKSVGASEMTPEEIRERLYKQFIIDDLDRDIDLKTALKITTRNRIRYVSLTYESVTPIVANLSVLGEFELEVGMGKVGLQ